MREASPLKTMLPVSQRTTKPRRPNHRRTRSIAFSRRVYIDNLRATLVVLLVAETGVRRTLKASGLVERCLDSIPLALLLAFTAVARTFVQGSLFLISGYCSYLSFHARGSVASFLRSRTIRYLLPGALAYVLPFTAQGYFQGDWDHMKESLRLPTILFSPDTHFLIRVFTFDLAYALFQHYQSHSFVDFPLPWSSSVRRFLFICTCIAFCTITVAKIGGSNHWFALPAYITGVVYLPDLHQYFARGNIEDGDPIDLGVLPTSSKTPPTPRSIPSALIQPQIILPLALATSPLALIALNVVSNPSYPLSFQSMCGTLWDATIPTTLPFSTPRELWIYASWCALSFSTISASLLLAYGTRYATGIDTCSRHSKCRGSEGPALYAIQWARHAVTRHVYLQAWVGFVVVEALTGPLLGPRIGRVSSPISEHLRTLFEMVSPMSSIGAVLSAQAISVAVVAVISAWTGALFISFISMNFSKAFHRT
ncbi:hypothetical protein CC1G_10745 [Coprinopsis cinerea okayama7|uniref:Uncharacterized protein n=1 Tax=Coprinopsis cinerea (strain Okayama-7 / 130 / ATCC MYA-4618 / FGSC 9003) TaxID=240176 RepID=A8P399_COPC7|nr:hypothetical protein CC1G_10745 [Coprinopsis cinerea okayama7\|eukprot:XP_001838503.1 hypothetical protein CC1G_10745 [Coprinopsis cinerea okayama7\